VMTGAAVHATSRAAVKVEPTVTFRIELMIAAPSRIPCVASSARGGAGRPPAPPRALSSPCRARRFIEGCAGVGKRSLLTKIIVIILIGLLVAFVGAQFVPVARTNPPAGAVIVAPGPVQAILTRSCFDCHSNGTRWPWYSHVAPMSWLVTDHVHDGRSNVNFSFWGDLSAEDRRAKAKKVVEEVGAGAMPIRPYLLLHHDARLSPEDRRTLKDWFSRPEAASAAATAPDTSSAAGRSNGGSWQDETLSR
jgi:hypothetical protein